MHIGSQYGKGPTRGAHSRNRESKSYNDRRSGSARPFRHREQDVIRVHSNHLSDSGALRGRMPGPGAARDDYKSQHFHQLLAVDLFAQTIMFLHMMMLGLTYMDEKVLVMSTTMASQPLE